MKNDFINNMTHEFKTPIATISLASDSITNPKILPDPKKVLRFADIIRQENRRMNAQVEKVLQIALVEKKDFELKITTLDIHNIVQAAADGMGLIIEDREGQIDCELNAEEHKVQGDYTHISNVINNLLDNAIKYSAKNCEITIVANSTKTECEISISDNGPGIKKNEIPSIFNRFYRIENEETRSKKGSGLGLFISKQFILLHGGKIEYDRNMPTGSVFKISLPL